MWQDVLGSCGDGRNASLGRRVISLDRRRQVKVKAPLQMHAQMRRRSRAHWCPARWRAYYIPVVGGAGKRRPENYDFRVSCAVITARAAVLHKCFLAISISHKL